MLRSPFLLVAMLCCATAATAQPAPNVADPAPASKKPLIQIGFDGRGRGVKTPSPYAEAKAEARRAAAAAQTAALAAQQPVVTVAAPQAPVSALRSDAAPAVPPQPAPSAPAAPAVPVVAAPTPAAVPVAAAPVVPEAPKMRSDSALGSDAARARAKQEAAAKAAMPPQPVAPQPNNSGLPLLPTGTH